MLRNWTDVYSNGLKDAVDAVRQTTNSVNIDYLVRLLYNRVPPKVYYAYNCHACSYINQPERATEEVSYCPHCFGNTITYTVKTSQKPQQPQQPLLQRIAEFRSKLGEMHAFYTGKHNNGPVIFDCGYTTKGFYAKFAGSDRVESQSSKTAILKSVVLTPILWDFNFSWTNYFGVNHIITPSMLFNILMGTQK